MRHVYIFCLIVVVLAFVVNSAAGPVVDKENETPLKREPLREKREVKGKFLKNTSNVDIKFKI